MKKRNIYRKLIMSASAAAATALCLTATTYAWFTKNEVVWVEETDFNLEFYKGLLISLDGQNFHQDVTNDELYRAVTKIDNKEEAEAAFKSIVFDGVSPVHDENGKIQYDENGYAKYQYEVVDEQTNEHSFKDATRNGKYLSFDLWFRIADGGKVSGSSAPKYNLVFDDDTYIKSKAGAQQIQLVNSLTDMNKTYSAGDIITVDGANSLRASVQTYDNANLPKSMIVYEPVNEYNLGSAAIEGREDDLHNPEKNAMFTYYNNFFSRKLEHAAQDGEAFNTLQTFNDGTSLGLFEAVKDTDLNGNEIYKYNDIKLTMYIWLEGWDADYFYGMTSSNELGRTMISKFSFTYKEV